MDESNSYIAAYRQEAEELLGDIEEAVLDIEESPDDKEAVNRLFRAMHTIKGSGSMFGFDDIASFTHHVETVLDNVRSGAIPIDKKLINLILASRDWINQLLDAADKKSDIDHSVGDKIIDSLKSFIPSSGDIKENAPAITEKVSKQKTKKSNTTYRIRFKPSSEIFASGMDPSMLIDELRELGECVVICNTEDVPELEHLSPESCYFYWDIILITEEELDAIKDVFIFVEDDSTIKINMITSNEAEEFIERATPRIGDILLDRGDISQDHINNAIKKQKRIGELLVESGSISRDKIESALEEQKIIKKQASVAKASSIRVASEKLDNLINLVGELVITQARLTQVTAGTDDIEIANSVEEVERLTAELRDSVLNVRMMPIGTTFSKFRRLVRDLSAELHKEINLVTEGAETELDKTVIERLDDPLVHLIRNSIDHGIQPPEQRKAEGKPEAGTIRLAAAHKGANVVITIEDDGKGMDSEIIKNKAIEKGLISAEADLSEQEIFAQIFKPGFSTSQSITSVSGRGVGMDVVKKTIESLRGSVEISSKKNKGTTITLKLPLTLAIINGLLVSIEHDFFVLPLMSVEECVELSKKDIENAHGSNILNVRGEIVPYIRLRDHFEIIGNPPEIEHVVITDVNSKRVGFVVDNVIGGHQTVIKSLGPAFINIKDISGATILGDGTVALILDVNALF